MKRESRPSDGPPAGSVLSQIAELQGLNGEQLRQRWFALMPDKPVPHTRAAVLCRLIHRVQEIAYGGLSPATQARLDAIADADEGKTDGRTEKPIAGTIFRTEWRGEQHEVVTIPEGFEYRGAKYRSLTAVARRITGQHLNGKLFFGLATRKRKDAKP